MIWISYEGCELKSAESFILLKTSQNLPIKVCLLHFWLQKTPFKKRIISWYFIVSHEYPLTIGWYLLHMLDWPPPKSTCYQAISSRFVVGEDISGYQMSFLSSPKFHFYFFNFISHFKAASIFLYLFFFDGYNIMPPTYNCRGSFLYFTLLSPSYFHSSIFYFPRILLIQFSFIAFQIDSYIFPCLVLYPNFLIISFGFSVSSLALKYLALYLVFGRNWIKVLSKYSRSVLFHILVWGYKSSIEITLWR